MSDSSWVCELLWLRQSGTGANCSHQALPKLHNCEQKKYYHHLKSLSVGAFCSVAADNSVHGHYEKAGGKEHTQLGAILCELRYNKEQGLDPEQPRDTRKAPSGPTRT